ncbi:MAG: hypothetical protein KatS3mg023_0439 [Armatimonadota bacterium]|nr:MAG: hypothetical protein KatS3mg023_0439 [Armatimonadota bacterium]
MKKAIAFIGLIAGIALLSWVGYGLFVLSRNPAPRFSLPPLPPPPANNAYSELISCVTSVREAGRLITLSQIPDYGTPAEKEPVLQANREVLRKAQELLQKITWVDHLEYRIGDPTVDNYRQLARLFVAQAKSLEQQGKYGQALDTYMDAFHFFEKVLYGGNGLHLTYQFMAYSEIFPAIPAIISRLSAQDAERGARRLEQLLKEEYPLEVLLQQEFRVWLTGWQRIVQEQSRRGFRLDLPKSDLERTMLYMPKAPLSEAAKQYVQQWLQQAMLPYPQQQFVDYPPALQQLEREMVVREPAGVALIVARYTYVRTRLRLLYTALRLEAYRKTHGRYPASLKDLGASPYFNDPFSSKPFVYRPQGNSYVLYSLGPNSQDDGGAPFPEGRLRREQPGDMGLVPHLPSRPS